MPACFIRKRIRAPGVGSMRIASWLGSGILPVPTPRRGGRLKTTWISVSLTGSFLPARMKKGTPLQRQLSISSSSATKVSVFESLATPSISR